MIQTIEGKDRGQELYRQFPGAITNMVLSRKQQWYDSFQYKGLLNNCRMMDLYIDNASPGVSSFISDITPQTIRRAYNEYTALFNKFLETDPLFSAHKTKNMTPEIERAVNALISDNIEKTYYRERCLRWSIDHIVRYGTAPTYTFLTDDYNANSLMTVKDDSYEGTYKQVYGEQENVVLSTPVHPANVIIDPRSNFQVSPDYIGFLGDICIANLAILKENPNYIQKNLKEVFEECKRGKPDEHWYSGPQQSERRDFTRDHSNITYLWTRLPIENNEEDPTWYAVEVIGDKIIRIEENVLDHNTIPLSLARINPRQYTWYGNSPLVDKICIYNLQYWLINMTVESTARLMDRIILYRGGELDVGAINARHQTGGLVPYVGQEQDLSKLMYAPNFPGVAFRENDWLMQLTRREDQDSSAMPNFNPQSEGGPSNKTLGGAQMMASIGEIKMGTMIGQFTSGLKDVAKHHLVLLRNSITGNKDNILGNINFACKISNVFNYIREGIDSQNRLTQLINFKATGLPEFKAIKTGQFIEDWVRNALKRENISDYLDKNFLKALEQQNMAPVAPPALGVTPAPGAVSPSPSGMQAQPQMIGAQV